MPSRATATALQLRAFTSSEAGAWSNAYLITGAREAILYDVFMVSAEAAGLAEEIARTGKTLTTVLISHAHPDHFMGLDAIAARFPDARIVTTANVAADVGRDGPWMFSLLAGKLGAAGPKRLIVPQALTEPTLEIEGQRLEVVEFGEAESRHVAALLLPGLQALLTADLVYHDAHLYLQERNLESWLARLDELERFVSRRGVASLHPGHGAAGDGELIASTRAYLRDFAAAVALGDPAAAERAMLDKYPGYHAQQFLSVFSIPAYFPAPA